MSPATPSSRRATLTRNTKETQIAMTIDLDGPLTSGQNGSGSLPNIQSPLPFLNHMLNTLACHGQFGFEYTAQGDIEVDPHHLVEDTGIVLGQLVRKALGDTFTGIHRAGCFAFPMDGTLAVVAMDLCGRPNLVWNVELMGRPLGNLDPYLFREFYKGFVDGLQCTLHINVPYADNDHHVIEATFKALARALREATRPLASSQTVISTKGVLEIQS